MIPKFEGWGIRMGRIASEWDESGGDRIWLN